MDEHQDRQVGRIGKTVGAATCLEGLAAGERLLRVEPGHCCDYVLEQASVLMDCASRASFIGVMDDEPKLVWAAHFLGAVAKALVDDAHMGARRVQTS